MDTIYTLFYSSGYMGAYREREAAQAAARARAEYRDELFPDEAVTWKEDATPGHKTRWIMTISGGWTGYHVTEDQLH
jgi:hypothetical protein